jgi:hypothetical protein
MRVRFENTFYVDNIAEARLEADRAAAEFLEISELAVPALIDFEFKVETPKIDELATGKYKITAYGSVKNSVLRPGN